MSTPDDASDRGQTLAAWLGEDAAEGAPLARVPRLVIASEPTSSADLELGELVGEGGMATVHRARQLALDREVAVKRVKRPEDAAAVRGLITEAMLSASLRHPNILPVHLLGETEEGEPAVVMPILGGVPWDALEVGEPTIARHLEIFAAVCQAVAHAHGVGIVHRDLKPANVRIGEHGETYLLDWGIAVRTDDRVHAPAGTPAFMAPEAGKTAPVHPSADLFGLAATLASVLLGQDPPRDTSGGLALAGLPAGLGRILERAGAADPEQRHTSASALRAEVLAWQERQGLERLLEAGRRQLEVLRTSEGADARRQFTVARFAFEQVLEAEPDEPQATRGLAACFDAIVRLELAEGQLGSAAGWLESHPSPSAELRQEIEHLRASVDAARAEEARLSAFGRQLDLRQDHRAIQWAMVAIIVAVVLNVIGVAVVMGPPRPATEPDALALRLVWLVVPTYAAMLVVGGLLIRRLKGPAGRRVVESFLVLGAVLLLVRVVGWRMEFILRGQPAVLVFETLLPVAWAVGLSHLSARFFVAAGIGLAGWFAVLAAFATPAQGWVHIGVFVGSFAALAWAWLDVQRREA